MNKLIFNSLCQAHGLPCPKHEFRFAPPRRWRFDYAFIEHKVALECEGGVWTHGRHTRGIGFLSDLEKYNEAAILGWAVIRCTPEMIETGKAFAIAKRMIAKRDSTLLVGGSEYTRRV